MSDSNPYEDDLNFVVDELDASLELIPLAKVPFDSRKLLPDEQMQRYMEMRANPEAWEEYLKEQGWPKTFKYARTMEGRLRKQEEVSDADTTIPL